MAIAHGDVNTKNIGSWQELFVPKTTERVKRLRANAIRIPEICLERVLTEMKIGDKFDNEPRILQRAHFFETYLRDKTVFIGEDELIVGNINSKLRGSTIEGSTTRWLEKELDDPVMDPQYRAFDRHVIHPAERKELREVIIPYYKERKLLRDHCLEKVDEISKEKAYPSTASCPHIPDITDWQMDGDVGHQMANYEKVLYKGLKGIREEVLHYINQLEQPYVHYSVQEKRDFYKAVLIDLDAAIAYAKRYADLAKEKCGQRNQCTA